MTIPPLHDDPTRTTPIGMARYADDFLEAALAVYEARGGTWPSNEVASVPVMFLVGQSLELSLKSYLLSKGVTLKEVRSKDLGHSLRANLKKAKGLGLLTLVTLEQEEIQAISTLDQLYASKQLQYIVTGAKQWPAYELIQSAAFKLLHGVSGQVGYKPRKAPAAA